MAATTLESAIPPHLQVERTCPARMPADYAPAFPAMCARFPEQTKDLVMAVIGVQYPSSAPADERKGLSQILSFVAEKTSASAPRHFDIAAVTDEVGAYNESVIAYWDQKDAYEKWKRDSGFGAWWDALDPKSENCGWFQEMFFPSVDRYETLYSNQMDGKEIEGAGCMGNGVSGLIREHVYWGSMRDRLPISQTDELKGQPLTPPGRSDTRNERIKIPGKPNLAVIRSGQDWSQTSPNEHKLYVETMHPVLVEGMNFLRDEGKDIGCYSCRLMDVLDPKSKKGDNEITFGLAYWDELSSLESWSKEHQTHLNIFGGFLRYVKKLDFKTTLHLYHEVLVLKPEQQYFEYVGCHEKTGMLAGMR